MHVYRYERLVQWGECDPAGIIYFPNYLRWMADGLTAMFLELGMDPADRIDRDTMWGLPSVGCSLEFLQPAKLHETIVHEVRIARVGSKSIDAEHSFLRDTTCLARGAERRVWSEMNIANETLTPLPVPEGIRKVLEADSKAAAQA